jgi:hypothetical protein
MPLLELGGNLHTIDAAVYVQGVMLNPRGTSTDHKAFVEAVRSEATKGVLQKDAKVRDNPKMFPLAVAAAMGPHLDDIARSMGRLHITQGRMLRAGVASRLFVLVLSLAEHCPGRASKETAYKIWEKAAQTKHMPDRSRATLETIFDAFHPAVHLCAAAEIGSDLWQAIQQTRDGRIFAEFLGFAEQLRRMGEAPGAKGRPLLDASITWKVPPDIILPRCEISVPTPAMIAESMSRWPDLSKAV